MLPTTSPRRIIVLVVAIVLILLFQLSQLQLSQDAGAYGNQPPAADYNDGTSAPDLTELKHRYESTESWRTPDSFEPAYHASPNRPQLGPPSQFRSKGEYLKQPIVADCSPGSDRVFLMLKTGASELWSKLPMHLLTTLTKFKHFAIYSDAPGSIAGYEVIDVLANVSDATKQELPEFVHTYNTQKWLHDDHGVFDHSEARSNHGWQLDRFKNLPMLKHAYAVAPRDTDWFVMIDADSYLFVDNLVQFLSGLDAQAPWYLGSIISATNGITFAHGGSGIVLSRGALDKTFGTVRDLDMVWEQEVKYSCCGDMMVGAVMQHCNVTAMTGNQRWWGDQPKQLQMAGAPNQCQSSFQGNTIWDLRVTGANWCLPVVSFHHTTPHDMERLYEYERLLMTTQRRGAITYGDIYRDFYAPYLANVRHDWDNNARDVVYSGSQNSVLVHADDSAREYYKPYASHDDCRQACLQDQLCLTYRWLPHDEYCGIGYSVRLGRPAHSQFAFKYDQDWGYVRNNTGAISGFLLDRIDQNVKSRCL